MKSCVNRVHRFLDTGVSWYTSIECPEPGEGSKHITKWVLELLENLRYSAVHSTPRELEDRPIEHDCSVKWDGTETRMWIAWQPQELGPRLWVARQAHPTRLGSHRLRILSPSSMRVGWVNRYAGVSPGGPQSIRWCVWYPMALNRRVRVIQCPGIYVHDLHKPWSH